MFKGRVQPKKGSKGWYSRGYLPHLDFPTLQFITFRLADSLPRGLLESWKEELKHLPAERRRLEEYRRVEAHVDRGSGACPLRAEPIARIVEACILAHHGIDYELHGWVVMPNHVHFLASFHPEADLGGVMKTVKGRSARNVNLALGRTGTLWYREYYDRFIRDHRHFESALAYIHANPVRAKLSPAVMEFRASSARWLYREVGDGLLDRFDFADRAEAVLKEYEEDIRRLVAPTEVGGPGHVASANREARPRPTPTEVGGPRKEPSAKQEDRDSTTPTEVGGPGMPGRPIGVERL